MKNKLIEIKSVFSLSLFLKIISQQLKKQNKKQRLFWFWIWFHWIDLKSFAAKKKRKYSSYSTCKRILSKMKNMVSFVCWFVCHQLIVCKKKKELIRNSFFRIFVFLVELHFHLFQLCVFPHIVVESMKDKKRGRKDN